MGDDTYGKAWSVIAQQDANVSAALGQCRRDLSAKSAQTNQQVSLASDQLAELKQGLDKATAALGIATSATDSKSRELAALRIETEKQLAAARVLRNMEATSHAEQVVAFKKESTFAMDKLKQELANATSALATATSADESKRRELAATIAKLAETNRQATSATDQLAAQTLALQTARREVESKSRELATAQAELSQCNAKSSEGATLQSALQASQLQVLRFQEKQAACEKLETQLTRAEKKADALLREVKAATAQRSSIETQLEAEQKQRKALETQLETEQKRRVSLIAAASAARQALANRVSALELDFAAKEKTFKTDLADSQKVAEAASRAAETGYLAQLEVKTKLEAAEKTNQETVAQCRVNEYCRVIQSDHFWIFYIHFSNWFSKVAPLMESVANDLDKFIAAESKAKSPYQRALSASDKLIVANEERNRLLGELDDELEVMNDYVNEDPPRNDRSSYVCDDAGRGRRRHLINRLWNHCLRFDGQAVTPASGIGKGCRPLFQTLRAPANLDFTAGGLYTVYDFVIRDFVNYVGIDNKDENLSWEAWNKQASEEDKKHWAKSVLDAPKQLRGRLNDVRSTLSVVGTVPGGLEGLQSQLRVYGAPTAIADNFAKPTQLATLMDPTPTTTVKRIKPKRQQKTSATAPPGTVVAPQPPSGGRTAGTAAFRPAAPPPAHAALPPYRFRPRLVMQRF